MKRFVGRPSPESLQRALGLALILLLTGWLYYPFLNNPLVFDDSNVFHTDILTTAAIAPWEMGIRGLPYFTLGWVETQIGAMWAHRSLSLALHILVAYQLCRFLEEILLVSGSQQQTALDGNAVRARWVAILVAIAFACHPVAVYGAGYLVQRTIVFATLFALLCLRAVLSALGQSRLGPAVWAAVWASLSILSKQHAVLVPISALALIPVTGNRLTRDTARIYALFLLLSLPAMLMAMLTNLSVIGQVYESSIEGFQAELLTLPEFSSGYEKWLFSASIQAQLFFAYWQQWLLPDPGRMSADLRVDFLRPWNHLTAWAWIVGLMLLPCAATLYSLRAARARLSSFAIAFTCILFTVELATVRFQEPYALYRSYLWSIGYCTLVAAFVYRLPTRVGIAALAMAIPLLSFQATERLDTFRSKLALWDDAARKLPRLDVGGASRVFFNRGGERFRAGIFDGAMDDINNAIRLSPRNGRFRVARAATFLAQGRAREALEDLETARPLMPGDAQMLFLLSRTLLALGRADEANAALIESARQGSFAAKNEISKRQRLAGDSTVELNQRP